MKFLPYALSFLISSNVFAATYKITYRMTKPDDGVYAPRFSDLEQRGVERNAEVLAIQHCQEAGGSNCISISAYITGCNETESFGGGIFKVTCYAEATSSPR